MSCPFKTPCEGMKVCGACKEIGLWTTRTTSSGRFEAAKRSGDVLSGVRRGDVSHIPDDLCTWLRGRGYDNLHIALGALALVGFVGLVLHALGVFC